jgi:predicted DNA-binding transcriptional regulator AlpA
MERALENYTSTRQPAEDDEGPLLPAKPVCERYRISDRTLDRWLANVALEFPRPIVINRRRYFRQRKLEAWERARDRGVA